MSRSVIVSAVRTPFGRLGGGLAGYEATELGSLVIRNALDRVGLENDEVEYVIMGQVLQAGAGQAPARQAAIGAGLPIDVGADTINKVCASSIRAVEIADSMIRAGDHDVVVTGGMESMSNAPYLLAKARFGYRLGNGELIDSMVFDGLTSTFDKLHMVQQASNVSRELGISRENQDAWAYRSHQRAAAAQDEGRFDDELVPVGDVRRDEHPRPDTNAEKLASLQPVFREGGTVTAGNSSGINDGAAALVIASEERARELGVEPLGAFVRSAVAGVDPRVMGIGPVPAVRKLLERAGVQPGDLDLVELNEAFASQSLAVIRELGLDPERVNVNGGAIAIGHPLGMSGARLVVTLLHELRRRGGRYGLATLCVGVGQGQAALFERPVLR